MKKILANHCTSESLFLASLTPIHGLQRPKIGIMSAKRALWPIISKNHESSFFILNSFHEMNCRRISIHLTNKKAPRKWFFFLYSFGLWIPAKFENHQQRFRVKGDFKSCVKTKKNIKRIRIHFRFFSFLKEEKKEWCHFAKERRIFLIFLFIIWLFEMIVCDTSLAPILSDKLPFSPALHSWRRMEARGRQLKKVFN